MTSPFYFKALYFCNYLSGEGEVCGAGSSPRFFNFGGVSFDVELESVDESLESVESASGWRRFKVGLVLPSSSISLVTDAFAFESRSRCALTR